MTAASDLKDKQDPSGSSRSIRRLLEQRWLVVVLALMFTGLGAALTGVLFKVGIKVLGAWRLNCWQTFLLGPFSLA
jgi:CIC family chloride channel protein